MDYRMTFGVLLETKDNSLYAWIPGFQSLGVYASNVTQALARLEICVPCGMEYRLRAGQSLKELFEIHFTALKQLGYLREDLPQITVIASP